MIAYIPKRKQYGDWYLSTIPRPANREHVAKWLKAIRSTDSSAEAARFRNWLIWLGTYPVRVRRAVSP